MNRVNLWQRIRSISSACLIFILSRIELIEGSMRTRSFSFREIVSGLRRASLDALEQASSKTHQDNIGRVRDFDFWFIVTFYNLGGNMNIARRPSESVDT